ncbi:MAG: hypothetical protein ACE5FI_08750 [Anaerolineales bacterium]
MERPIWAYKVETPGTWEDYVSAIRVFPDRVEYTLGWREPSHHAIRAENIIAIRRGTLSMKNIITITTPEWPPHELVAAWDRQTQEAFIYAVKQVMKGDAD